MALIATVIVLAVVGTFLALYRYKPQWTQRWFERIEWIRVIGWTTIVLGFAFVLIASGSLGMIVVGALALGYGVLYVLERDLLDMLAGVIGR